MTIASLARRLAELEASRRPAPGEASGWLAFATRGDLEQLEALLEPIEAGERAATGVDQLLVLEIEARATRRMLAGKPPG